MPPLDIQFVEKFVDVNNINEDNVADDDSQDNSLNSSAFYYDEEINLSDLIEQDSLETPISRFWDEIMAVRRDRVRRKLFADSDSEEES